MPKGYPYKSVDENDQTSPYDVGSSKPTGSRSRYSEDTPSFEGIKSGNAGRGGMGTPGLKQSADYQQYLHEKRAGGARTDSYDEWKNL